MMKEAQPTTNLSNQDIEEIQKIAKKNPAVEKLYSLYLDYNSDPASLWRGMVVFAQKELNTQLKNKKLDVLEDGYHKSLWEILKGGAAVSKTVSSLNEKEKPVKGKKEELAEDKEEDEEIDIPVITAETAGTFKH